MNNEFFEALGMLEKERGISEAYLVEKIKAAIVIAVKKGYDVEDNVEVVIEPTTGKFNVAIVKMIVDEVTDPRTEITLTEAQNIKARARVGTQLEIPLKTKEFGRIAAQTAKQLSARLCVRQSATRCMPKCSPNLTRLFLLW